MLLSAAAATPQFESFVLRHEAPLRRYLRYLGVPYGGVDDVVQDTFLAVLAGPFEFRGDAAAAQWLRTVARRLLVQRARAASRQATTVELERAEAAFAAQLGDDDGAAQREALRACLQQLPERHVRALQLRYGDDASVADVATALGIRAAGVESLLARVRRALRACMQRRLHA